MSEKNQRIAYALIAFLGLGLIADHIVLENRINERIAALEAELETIRDQLQELRPIDDLKTTYIPAEWIDSTNTSEQDLTLYSEMDPDNRITVNATAITWSQMDRSEERRVYTELDEDQRAGLVTEFGFTLNRFLNNDTTNRRIVSLWMLAETVGIGTTGNRSFIQIYAEELLTSQEEYKLVMHQRVEGSNTFVGIGPVLQTNQTYYARVILYGNYTKYQVSESPDFQELLYDSSEYVITPRTYRYQMFCVMVVNAYAQKIWSTGKVTQIKTS